MRVQAAEAPFRDGKTWCGDPDFVQSPDNPYVKLAESNVTRSLRHPDLFWYVWGYAAPESTRKGDAKLKELALAEMDTQAAKLAEKPSGYWDILTLLECVRLFKKAPDVPAEKIAGWLAQLRPSVQANYDTNVAHTAWMSVAPNTLHQSAAILQLASQLYAEPKYAALARQLVETTATYQNADGAFRYIRDSGPSQIYYGFDSTFLGRYYQLSRDPRAKEMLVRMAGYSRDVLANGLMESSSSPWWKHHWGTGGPLHGIEIVAGLSRDPLTRAVAEKRLSGGQPYYFSYYAMFCWDPTIPRAPLAPDLCRYNTNIAGPQIRKGSWQAVMPGKAYADTGIGCTVVAGEKPFTYDAYLETAALPVLDKGVNDAYHRPGALLIAGPEETGTRATLAGTDWVAAGWTFHPRPGFYGDPTSPPARGWRLAQVWFADGAGFGGWLTVTCTQQTGVLAGPRGYLGLGHDPRLDEAVFTRLHSGALALQAWGAGVRAVLPMIGKERRYAWIMLDGAGERAYKAGESFGYGLSGCPDGATPWEVRTFDAGAALGAEIRRPAGNVLLLFNPTDAPITVDGARLRGKTLWRSTGTPGVGGSTPWAPGPVGLKGYELVALLP